MLSSMTGLVLFLQLMQQAALDEKSQQEAKKKFEAYYLCLTKQNEYYEKVVRIGGEAVLATEGQRIHLLCRTCATPYEHNFYDNVIWKRSQGTTVGEENVRENENIVFTRVKDLIMRRPRVKDSGQYYCMKRNSYEAAYHVDVVKTEPMRQSKEIGLPGPRILSDVEMQDENLRLYTEWAEWGVCNQCGSEGTRRRIGICSLKLLDKTKPTNPEDIPQLRQYSKGIPCRSSLLPTILAVNPTIEKRHSEAELGLCFRPCPSLPSVLNITDSNGQLIEVINPEAGIVSGQEAPTNAPLTKRKFIYEDEGNSIKLECPHDAKGDVNVIWMNGTKYLDPLTIPRKTRGRIKIDARGFLHIRKLRYADSHYYSCWIEDKLIASIKINVRFSGNYKFDQYIVYVGLGFVVLTIIIMTITIVRVRSTRKQNSIKKANEKKATITKS